MAAFAICAFAGLNAAPPSPLRIVALGDSLTAGYGLRPAEAFPAALGVRLRKDGYAVVVTNAGATGETTQAGLARLPWALSYRPDLLILELGCNDMLNGLDPKVTEDNLGKMIIEAQAEGARVLFVGMRANNAAPFGDADRRRFDAVFPALAERFGLLFYPHMLEGVSGRPRLELWGGIHPNREGVVRIVEGIAPLVERALEGLRERTDPLRKMR